MKQKTGLFLFSLFLALTPTFGISAENLITNPNFAAAQGEFPDAWKDGQTIQEVRADTTAPPPGSKNSLRVKIRTEKPGRSGEITQTIPVAPNTRYHMSGWLRGSRDGLGFFQIKRRKGREELERIDTDKNARDWKQVRTVFNSGEADNVIVQCRWAQGQKQVGETVWFAGPELIDATGLPLEGEHEPIAVSTFESIGLYWKPRDGGRKNECKVSYRISGSETWNEGFSLWFDPNHHNGLPRHSQEYRGSVVHLQQGTEYEIRLRLEKTETERILRTQTWNEKYRIKKKVFLPEKWEETFVIEEGGSPEEGCVLYCPAEGAQSVGDAGGRQEVNLRINASHVIVRDLTLRNAQTHGIVLEKAHHVVIEGCDISGWGKIAEDGFGVNFHSAIYGNSNDLEHIVIQRCDLHHPRSHSNSWLEERTLANGEKTSHPMGPQGIVLRRSKGGVVIRHNRIFSDMTHMFNDGMGEYANFSHEGFPGRDSDIYGNFVSHCWDDGLECEGANMNVRVWNNCTDICMMSLAGASTSLGPIYFWRNIALRSRFGPGDNWDGTKGGGLLKLGNESRTYTRGRMYVFHNTIYQPEPWPGSRHSSGCRAGINCTGKTKRQENLVSRNNILHLRTGKDRAIGDPFEFENNDFDYDLIFGQVTAREGSEKNGIRAVPQYEASSGKPPGLLPGSPGHDAGHRIPNFNDDHRGKAPDMGAIETSGSGAVPATWPAFPPLHPQP